MTVLTGLIWVFLVLWIIIQHFQLLSSHRKLFADRSRLRGLARLHAELRDRVNMYEEDAHLQNVKHGVTLHSLDTLQREFTEQSSQLLGAQGQVQHLEQSLLNMKSAQTDAENRLQALKLAHEKALSDKDAEHKQRHQAQLALSEQTIGQLNQHAAALTTDLEQAQATLQTTQNDRALVVQMAGDLQRKLEQLEKTLRENEKRLQDQLNLTEQAASKAQQWEQALLQSQAQVSRLQSELQQIQQTHLKTQESWQQEKGNWVRALEQQQSVHQGQLQELGQSHQNSLAQALSSAANELQTLEKSLIEKMQGMAQSHAQEHARTQNELTGLQQQFQQLSQSRAELEGQLHASNHQKQAVQDRVMDFEKRWSQLSHEQQQAHEMLMNLKSLVTAS